MKVYLEQTVVCVDRWLIACHLLTFMDKVVDRECEKGAVTFRYVTLLGQVKSLLCSFPSKQRRALAWIYVGA